MFPDMSELNLGDNLKQVALLTAIHERKTEMANEKILKLPAVIETVGLGRSTIYRMMAEGKFPQSVKLGARAVGWKQSDIDEYLNSLGAGK